MAEIYAYQELLCKKEELAKEIEELSTLSDLPALRRTFQREKQRLAEIQMRLQELRAIKEHNAKELAEIKGQAARLETQIYDGSVTNSRELALLQDKGEELKRKEEVLTAESQATAAELEQVMAKGNKVTAKLKEIKAEFDVSQGELKATHAKLKAAMADYDRELNKLAPKINQEKLTFFLKNRQTYGGKLYAIVREGGTCSVCCRTLTKSTINRAADGKEVYCDNCNRILLNEAQDTCAK